MLLRERVSDTGGTDGPLEGLDDSFKCFAIPCSIFHDLTVLYLLCTLKAGNPCIARVNCLIEHILNIDLKDMTEVKAYGR